MTIPLLKTKLYKPPYKPNLVPRPHLIERLNKGLHGKLTLISAPAGFGKSTLISEWIADCEQSAAWLSLDEGDSTPTRFLSYLVAAMQTVTPSFGQDVLGMLQTPQPTPTESLLTTLLNEITVIQDDFILVLDDYHALDTKSIDDALTFFIEHLPPQLHLVIITREDPGLPLARYRVRGQLTELRANDLRFTPAEATIFLNQMMGLDLSEEDIAALERRTEGWIAGLQLAAISMQSSQDTADFIKSFSGSHRFVLDYLIEEVLDHQPDSIQTFLLQTAILDRLNGRLCNALTGLDDGQATLETLTRANLFIIPLDDERRWYRYHHLFADLLRQRLRHTQSDQLRTLHVKASEWYEKNGFIDDAIEHALSGEHFERAATLIEDQFGDDYERGDLVVLQRWLAEMPEELVLSKPHLCILDAWILFSLGHLDGADRRLQVAEKMLDPDPDQVPDSPLDKDQPSGTDRMKLAGRVATIRSFLVSFNGDVPGTIRYAQKALEYLPEQELDWRGGALIALGDAYASEGQMAAAHKTRADALVASEASGDIYILMIVNLSLAEVLRQQGELRQVVDTCERLLSKANESGISESPLAGWLFGIWAEVLAELNDLDGAVFQAKKGVELAARGQDILHIASSNLCLLRVLFSSGDIAGAEDVIQSMENTAREYDMPHSALRQLSAWQARIWLAQGKLDTASQWSVERGLAPEGEPAYPSETEYIAFARVLIAQGRLDEATPLLRRLLEAAEAGGRTSRMIEILILQALAAESRGDAEQAMSTLEQALSLAESGGFIRTFVDEGPPMARLLYKAHSRGISPDYVSRLLGAFPVAEPTQVSPSKAQTPEFELVEPLSARETEVLQLVAEGLTNQEIANKLFLSLNTVKAHTRNIYGKLDAHHRTDAVARARALGILDLN